MEKMKILACSGGPDSMALLNILPKEHLIVAHVNYQKRPTASRDEQIVKTYCQAHHIPVHVCYPIYPGHQNFQAWARDVRYDFFVELYHRYHADTIYIAHQMDDHLETYLFQKQRGMLCEHYGLQKVSYYKGCRIERPLLAWTKKECQAYCDKHSVPYGIDESNLGNVYTRNRIRHSCIDTMSNEDKDRLNKQIEQENDQWLATKKRAQLFLKSWNRDPRTLDWYSLEEWLYGRTKKRYGKKECLSLLKQVQTDCVIDLGDFQLESYRHKLYIEPIQDTTVTELKSLQYGAYPGFELKEKGTVIEGMTLKDDDFPLTVRPVRSGDFIQMKWGTKKVHRFLMDRKIPRIYRQRWMVVENRNQHVIFVPQIGCDVQHFSVKPNAFMIQCFSYLKENNE